MNVPISSRSIENFEPPRHLFKGIIAILGQQEEYAQPRNNLEPGSNLPLQAQLNPLFYSDAM